jgi:hypothetical protein
VTGVALGVIQTDPDLDPSAALASVPGARRYLVRPSPLDAPAPPGVEVLACSGADRVDAAACLRATAARGRIVVLRAGEHASAELADALARAPGEAGAAGRYRARVRLRFLERDIEVGPAVIAWDGDPRVATPAVDLAGALLRDAGDLRDVVAALDENAGRRAAGRTTVATSDFTWRPVWALGRRLAARRHDGVRGLILSVIETYGEVLTAAKAWERIRSDRPVLASPPGFRRVESPSGLVVVRTGVAPDLERILLAATPDSVEGRPLEGAGRGGAWLVPAGGDETAVLRWYRRGGLPRHFVRDRFLALGMPRPARELLASEEARRRGIEVPEVLGVRVDRGGPGLYRGAIVTRWIGDTVSLADLLATSAAEARRETALRAVGTTLRAMHDRGLHHRDLNAGNILLRPAGDGFAVWIIDLDRATVGPAVSPARRRRALDRLARSLARPAAGGRAFGRAERDALERAYAQAT